MANVITTLQAGQGVRVDDGATGNNIGSVVLLDPVTGNPATGVSSGTSGDGITQPTGGDGMLGWLSGIYSKLISTLSVQVNARVVLSQQKITVPITTGVTLASLCTGAAIPADAVSAEIQADGNTIRVRYITPTVTPTTGIRIDDGYSKIFESGLSTVTLVAAGGTAVSAIVTFFDRV